MKNVMAGMKRQSMTGWRGDIAGRVDARSERRDGPQLEKVHERPSRCLNPVAAID